MKWPVATIGEVCEVVSGATPKTGKPEFWDGNVPWVTPKDLSELGQKYLSDTPRKITRAGLKSCSARMLPAQSVLFSSRAPIGLVAINTLPVCTNQGFKNLVPRFDLVSPDFLFWWLKTQEKHIQSKGRGATFKEVSKKIVEDLQISLPPLAEQKRLAGILDAADALRAKRREALAELDTLLQSTFLDMFGDPVTNPMGWEVVTVGDEIGFLTSGSRGWAKYYAKDGDTFIRIQNLKDGQLDLGDIAFVNAPESAEARRTKVEPGDVLLSITADLGRTAVVPGGIAKAHINQHLAILRFTSLNPVFVSYQLASKGGQAQFDRLNREGVKAGLNFNDVKSIRLTNPPLDLQHRFAAIVESVEQQKASQRAHLDELDTLFASLQSRAFRGDL